MTSVAGGRPLQGEVKVPGDKSISHRGLLIAALADGRSCLRNLSSGTDVARSTRGAIEDMGAVVEDGDSPRGEVIVSGGPSRLHQPAGPIDCGNSGTSMRLLAGLVSGWSWTTRLIGDESLSVRPMDRVADPLRLMGASVAGLGDNCHPPITVGGGDLRGIEYTPPMASAQVKSAVLLAGLRADGETVVTEPVATRAHTEEVLVLAGVEIEVREEGRGREVRVRQSVVNPFDLDIPGDPSQAAFWVVAACLVPDSEVRLPGIYVGAGRRGFLDVLKRMGADLDEVPTVGAGPTADLIARYSTLRATEIRSEEIPSLDEVPILAVAASMAEGTTVFRDVGSELRVKESDRMEGTAGLLRAFGVEAEIVGDDLVVHGTDHLSAPGRFDARGDHRMAMSASIATVAAREGGTTTMVGWDVVATSYPRFLDALYYLTSEGPKR